MKRYTVDTSLKMAQGRILQLEQERAKNKEMLLEALQLLENNYFFTHEGDNGEWDSKEIELAHKIILKIAR